MPFQLESVEFFSNWIRSDPAILIGTSWNPIWIFGPITAIQIQKILSGFWSDPTNSEQIHSDLVGHRQDLLTTLASWATLDAIKYNSGGIGCTCSQYEYRPVKMCGKAENNKAKSGNEDKGVPWQGGVTEGDRRWQNDVTKVWQGREVLENVNKTENRGY